MVFAYALAIGVIMKPIAVRIGILASSFICTLGCHEKGLTMGSSGGAAGGVSQGGGSALTGGAPGSGGVVTTGGTSGSGGATSSGGEVGAGGMLSAGGAVGYGGEVGSGGTPSAGGSSGQSCGGPAMLLCPSGQFCDLATGDCRKDVVGFGTCAAIGPVPCPDNYAPVCGCDGVTYSNDCTRRSAGISKASDGACPTAKAACPSDISQIATWPCTEGLTCEYGTDPRASCRDTATCKGGAWSVTTPELCSPLPKVTCPATRDAAAGQTCSTDGAYCTYGDLSCTCSSCPIGAWGGAVVCGTALAWQCATPNSDPTCPAGLPRLGSACTSEAQTCTYGCGNAEVRVCKQGAWYPTGGGVCPL